MKIVIDETHYITVSDIKFDFQRTSICLGLTFIEISVFMFNKKAFTAPSFRIVLYSHL